MEIVEKFVDLFVSVGAPEDLPKETNKQNKHGQIDGNSIATKFSCQRQIVKKKKMKKNEASQFVGILQFCAARSSPPVRFSSAVSEPQRHFIL